MTKNIKLTIIFLIFFILFIIIIKNKNIRSNNSKNLFIDSNSILSLIENNKVGIIYDYLKYRDKVFCIYNIYNINNNQNKENKDFIKSRFPSIKFINKFQFYFYSKFFKEKIML